MQSTAHAGRKKKAGEPAPAHAVYSKTGEALTVPVTPGEVAKAQAEELERVVGLLEGTVKAEPLDEVHNLITELAARTGEPSDDFLYGKRMKETIELPDPRKDRRGLIRRLEEVERNQTSPPPLEGLSPEERDLVLAHMDSYIRVQVDREGGIAFLTDTYMLPAPIARKREKYAELFRKVLESGNPDSISAAMGCWNALKTSFEEGIDTGLRAQYYHKTGDHEVAQVGDELARQYNDIAKELYARLGLLAAGMHPYSEKFQESVYRTESMMGRARRLNSRIQDLQALSASMRLTGKRAMERIEAEIKRSDSYYNVLEVEAYKGIKNEIERAQTSMRSLSSAGIERIPTEGMDGLTAREQETLQYVLSLSAQLEFMAWKADLRGLEKELQQASAESRSPRTPLSAPKLSKLSAAQLTRENRDKVRDLSYRAKRHVDLMKDFVNSLDPGLLSKDEKKEYMKRFESLKGGAETGEESLASLDEALAGGAPSTGKKGEAVPEGMDARARLWEALAKEGFKCDKVEERYRQLEVHIAGEDDSVSPFVAASAAVGLLEKGLKALDKLEKKGFGDDFEVVGEAADLRGELGIALEQNKQLVAALEAETGPVGSLKKGLHTLREKLGMDQMESQSGLEVTTVPELEAAARDVNKVMGSLAALVGERAMEKEAQDPNNPWHVQAAAYTKMYTLRYSLAVLAGGAAAGGIFGGAFFRSPAGAWAGAKVGANIARWIVVAAGAGIELEAAYRYSSGMERERALEDMQLGATYLAFGLFGGPVRLLSSPLQLGIAGGVALPNALLLPKHIEEGAYMDVAADVAYVAMGTTAFIRTATGAFRMIKLGKGVLPANTASVATASGVARVPLGTRVAERMERVHRMGYSASMVGMNAAFSGIVNRAEILGAIEDGNYGAAASIMGKGFTHFTREMVAFDFVIFGVGWGTVKGVWKGGVRAGELVGVQRAAGAAGRAGVRAGKAMKLPEAAAAAKEAGKYVYRATIPKAKAKLVRFVHNTGVFENVAEFASEAGLEQTVEANARLLELTFVSGGEKTLSAGYVKKFLGLKSSEYARKIAVEINRGWKNARAAFSKARSSNAWKWAGRRMKGRGKGVGQAVALQSLVAYHIWASTEEENNAKEFGRLLTLSELNFIEPLLSGPNEEAMLSQVEPGKLYAAMGLVREISDEIEEASHGERLTMQSEGEKPSGLFFLDASLLKFGRDAKKRKWLLSACALALLMEGKEATKGEISRLAAEVQNAAARNRINLAYRPLRQKKGAAYSTHFGTVVFMASALLRVRPDEFGHAYSSFSKMQGKKKPQGILQDYAITSIYAATAYGKGEGVSIPLLRLSPTAAIADYRRDAEWHTRAALSLFEGTRETPHYNKFGWQLLFALGSLGKTGPSRKEIDDAFANANGKVLLWGK